MNNEREWILASDTGLHNMYLGQLAEGQSASVYLAMMAGEVNMPSVPIELFNVRLILHQVIPLTMPNGALTVQTIFKVMPFPLNPDGGHVIVKATALIDVEGDASAKEMLMGQLKECREMELAEKERRSKIARPKLICDPH